MPILKDLKQHKIVLDTHIWLWLSFGEKKFTDKFLTHLEEIKQSMRILISPLTIWEIGMLVEKKRIELDRDLAEWIDFSMAKQHIQLAPITVKIAIQSNRLPSAIHGDPVDRILISTANEENAVLVTCDRKLLAFGKAGFLTVFDPCQN